MAELTPRNALTILRQNADAVALEQARLLREMPIRDAVELLLLQGFVNVNTIRMLHDQIEPGAGHLQPMPDAEKVN